MTAQELVVPDLTSDNFDLIRIPSLAAFPSLADNDDLIMMARMGSLFDGSAKQLGTVSSPQSVNISQQPQQQMQHAPPHIQQLLSAPHQSLPFSPGSPGYPMLSPRLPAPQAAAAQSCIPSPPQLMVCYHLCVTTPLLLLQHTCNPMYLTTTHPQPNVPILELLLPGQILITLYTADDHTVCASRTNIF